MRRAAAAGWAAIACAIAACSAGHGIEDPVRLAAGLISGGETSASGVRVFRGIPFAAPPVGSLRWREPQPVPHWEGVRDASEFGDVCIQPEGRNWTNIAVMEGSPPMSEDCLFLNVWTPAARASDRLPVMVYFFGGAFTEGAGSAPLYNGTALAERGAVVVTMNYRLGPFGFFAHPALTADSERKTSGNYGIMDMLGSLEWVQSNIEAFGGDPANVTIFGQSAGAMAIASLVASPRASGLFQRAISESIMGGGATPGMSTLARAEETGLAAANAAGVSTAEELRAMTADQVVASFRSAGMIVDNWAIPEDPALVFADGRQNEVDVLMGANKDESFFSGRAGTPEQFEQRARAQYGDLADDYLAAYPHATSKQAGIATAETFRDQAFWVARALAEYQRKLGRKAYVYFFAQNPPGQEGEPPLPATHASELPYVFDNLGEVPLYPDRSNPDLAAASEADKMVAERVASYWVNFARSGDPNGEGLPPWPAHAGLDSVTAAILDADPASERLPGLERMRVFDRNLERALQAD